MTGKHTDPGSKAVEEMVRRELGAIMDMAEAGDPDGLYGLGLAHLYGWGVKEDKEKGIKLFEAACNEDHFDAMIHLLRMYMRCEYTMSTEKAVEFSQKTAAEGLSEGQLYLGIAYMDGVGVEQDHFKAAELFRKSANQGEAEARNALAFLYQEGLGVQKDVEKAFKLFKNAAAAGSINAQFQTGACYESGEGVKRDLKKAAEWYAKAADGGDTFAMERLGIVYSIGSADLPEDPVKAFEWFLEAALGGMLGSMVQVGICYLEGYGVEEDREECMKWLRLSASSGSEEAVDLLSELENGGDE